MSSEVHVFISNHILSPCHLSALSVILFCSSHKPEQKVTDSEVTSDEEEVGGDFTVYECPGLAPVGRRMHLYSCLCEDTNIMHSLCLFLSIKATKCQTPILILNLILTVHLKTKPRFESIDFKSIWFS